MEVEAIVMEEAKNLSRTQYALLCMSCWAGCLLRGRQPSFTALATNCRTSATGRSPFCPPLIALGSVKTETQKTFEIIVK
jgi:hypothetical protein